MGRRFGQEVEAGGGGQEAEGRRWRAWPGMEGRVRGHSEDSGERLRLVGKIWTSWYLGMSWMRIQDQCCPWQKRQYAGRTAEFFCEPSLGYYETSRTIIGLIQVKLNQQLAALKRVN